MLRSSWQASRVMRSMRGIHVDALDRLLQTPAQQYVSSSNDPYVNLSIEHYMLQHSSPESVILFLYINRPSVILGRNQNPWSEVNLRLLDGLDLVRRRSGGGTVFHDAGNVNWTVISPPAAFTRDKHAEMVVRALRQSGVDRARVNERHDVVLDQGEASVRVDEDDTHRTAYDGEPLKVSGSAYKLTKYRALHHGTCLLTSPNIHQIGRLLRSPLKQHIAARGVESVSSPVANIGLDTEVFKTAVVTQFRKMYTSKDEAVVLEDSCGDIKAIGDGVAELRSPAWTFLQTPQFVLTAAPDEFAGQLQLTVRYGVVTESKLTIDGQELQTDVLTGVSFHEKINWQILQRQDWPDVTPIIQWLEKNVPFLNQKG